MANENRIPEIIRSSMENIRSMFDANKIVGDPFAPRNQHCLKIDTLLEPPMFRVSDTHYAKTWLLDPRSPKLEKPEIIRDIHGKLVRAFNIEEE